MSQNRHSSEPSAAGGTPGAQERQVRTTRDLGEAIAEARRAQRLTQTDLSDIAGIERSRLAKIEAGTSTRLLDQLLRLLTLVGLEVVVRMRDPHRGGIR